MNTDGLLNLDVWVFVGWLFMEPGFIPGNSQVQCQPTRTEAQCLEYAEKWVAKRIPHERASFGQCVESQFRIMPSAIEPRESGRNI